MNKKSSFTRPALKTFEKGARCKVCVPREYRKSHGTLNNAMIEIVSKKEFMAKYTAPKIEEDKVVCKIIKAPNSSAKMKLVGLEFPIRRTWLTRDGHKCDCDLRTILMVTGCRCGGY